MGNVQAPPPSPEIPGTFLKNLKTNVDLKDYPTLDELLKRFGLVKPDKPSSSGSANDVYYFKSLGDRKNLALRISKIASFEYINKGRLRPNGVSAKEEEQSFNNWTMVNKLKLCPEIYFYGYIRGQIKDNPNLLVLCQLGEKYQMNLAEFYESDEYGVSEDERQVGKLRDIDIKIQEQLVEALNRIGEKPLNLICFDIKPANSVINVTGAKGAEIVVVKLIDWDGDWCLPYDILKKADKSLQINKQIGLINTIITANQYLRYFNWNIFMNYFKQKRIQDFILAFGDKTDRRGNKTNGVLKQLFCKEELKFRNFSGHYIFGSDLYEGYKFSDRISPEQCFAMFDVLLNNCTKLENGNWNIYNEGTTGGGNRTRTKSRKKRSGRKGRRSGKRYSRKR